MKLINNKRFNVQLNRAFLQEPIILIFLISIIGGVFASLWLPYGISKPYKGMIVSSLLVFLCITVPKPYDAERLKRDISYFLSLNYCRREYFKNKIIMVNLFIGFFVMFYGIIMFIIMDSSAFSYLGFIMDKSFISFLKISFVNIIIYNLFYGFFIIVGILFIKFRPNKMRNVILGIVWAIALLIFQVGVSDIYIQITAPNIVLVCSISCIFIAYYIYYRFIMSLDV